MCFTRGLAPPKSVYELFYLSRLLTSGCAFLSRMWHAYPSCHSRIIFSSCNRDYPTPCDIPAITCTIAPWYADLRIVSPNDGTRIHS